MVAIVGVVVEREIDRAFAIQTAAITTAAAVAITSGRTRGIAPNL